MHDQDVRIRRADSQGSWRIGRRRALAIVARRLVIHRSRTECSTLIDRYQAPSGTGPEEHSSFLGMKDRWQGTRYVLFLIQVFENLPPERRQKTVNWTFGGALMPKYVQPFPSSS